MSFLVLGAVWASTGEDSSSSAEHPWSPWLLIAIAVQLLYAAGQAVYLSKGPGWQLFVPFHAWDRSVGDALGQLVEARSLGLYVNPNELGLWSGVAAILAWTMLPPRLRGLGVAMAVLTLLLSQSRGSGVALLAVLIVGVTLTLARGRLSSSGALKAVLSLAVAGGLAIGLALVIAPEGRPGPTLQRPHPDRRRGAAGRCQPGRPARLLVGGHRAQPDLSVRHARSAGAAPRIGRRQHLVPGIQPGLDPLPGQPRADAGGVAGRRRPALSAGPPAGDGDGRRGRADDGSLRLPGDLPVLGAAGSCAPIRGHGAAVRPETARRSAPSGRSRRPGERGHRAAPRRTAPKRRERDEEPDASTTSASSRPARARRATPTSTRSSADCAGGAGRSA